MLPDLVEGRGHPMSRADSRERARAPRLLDYRKGMLGWALTGVGVVLPVPPHARYGDQSS